MVKSFRLSPVLWAAFGVAAGFYLPGVLFTSTKWPFFILLIPAAALCFFRVLSSINPKSRTLHLTAAYSTAFAAGLSLGICAAGLQGGPLNFGIPEERVTAVKGVLLEDPGIAGGRAKAVLSLRESTGTGGQRVSAGGELTVFFPGENAQALREFGRGAVVFAEGSLVEASGGGRLFFAESLHIVKPASALERLRTGIRLDLLRRFNKAGWGGLALALLVGIRDNLDSNLAALYREAGCSHVLALSGMHLAVLIAIISLLLKKPLGLRAAAIAGMVIIILYWFLVGPMPSLNRSVLMYLLGAFSVLCALPKDTLSLLGMAFVIQILISPGSGSSISFTLSYLALAGILIIGKAVRGLLAGKIPEIINMPVSASVGAFLATAFVTSYFFGVLRPVGIIISLILIPLTTVFMIGSLIWLFFNLFIPLFCGFLNPPLALLYRLMEKIVSLGGMVPGMETSRPMAVLALSLVISVFIMLLESKRRRTAGQLLPFN
ncbi:MAG: ComEC/Rec2 family competence protein [Treponema sp.]|nr:ComEC/Rec2 family competence protein [Treponema sp.]